jgi:hypothetical protein
MICVSTPSCSILCAQLTAAYVRGRPDEPHGDMDELLGCQMYIGEHTQGARPRAQAAAGQQPDAEESMCVVCFDAPKQYAMLPCLHMCACEACTQ